MNDKQRENLAKLCHDLVKLPCGLCLIGPLINTPNNLEELLFFGASIAIGLIYLGHRLESTL